VLRNGVNEENGSDCVFGRRLWCGIPQGELCRQGAMEKVAVPDLFSATEI